MKLRRGISRDLREAARLYDPESNIPFYDHLAASLTEDYFEVDPGEAFACNLANLVEQTLGMKIPLGSSVINFVVIDDAGTLGHDVELRVMYNTLIERVQEKYELWFFSAHAGCRGGEG